MKTSDRLIQPIRQAEQEIKDLVSQKPKSSIAGIVAIGLIVAIGIWAWPEVHRTIHIHRM